MGHKVRVNLVNRTSRKEQLLSNKTIRLPKKIVRLLFGEATQILIMQPGQSIQAVEFYELTEEKQAVK